MAGWLHEHAGGERRILLAGSGTERFDRRWLELWAPTVAGRVHYAGLDVGVLRRTCELVGWDPFPTGGVHRGMPDVLDGLAQFKLIARALGLQVTRNWASCEREGIRRSEAMGSR
jgi:hypothetical protein